MDADWNETLEHRLLHRLMFFTDAVFAIVMTLLALELKPPIEGALSGAGADVIAGPLFAFTLSFAIAAVFWLAHMSTTRGLRRFDWPTAIANVFFLFPICLIPFVSAWVGEAVTTSQAWAAYSLVLIGCSAANIVLVLVQNRGGGRLVGGITPRERIYRLARSASPGLAWSVGLVSALAGQPRIAMGCWILIPVFLRLATAYLKPKPVVAKPQPKAEAA
jgi:uncharacterized membrane protein